MSERIVSNPENHGWELVGGKWIWAAGSDTGHILDGDTEGQIATWDGTEWTPDSSLTIDADGNVITEDSIVIQDKAGGVGALTELTFVNSDVVTGQSGLRNSGRASLRLPAGFDGLP